MKRREFITLLGGAAAVSWVPTARARAIGFGGLPCWCSRLQLCKSAWPNCATNCKSGAGSEGHNLRLDIRTADDAAGLTAAAEEVFKSGPEVIFAPTSQVARAVQTQTRTIPIVFEGAGDPAENGLVSNIARPEGNTTGFANSFARPSETWAGYFLLRCTTHSLFDNVVGCARSGGLAMRRRDFMTLLGGAAVWPAAVWGQSRSLTSSPFI
jgi:putative tryptophan/tyrosine transport system substrate-binding protein